MNIPIVDLSKQYRSIRQEVNAAILAVCGRADFILGREVAEFETAFATYIGIKNAVGVASGTDAIKLMALAAGIGPGDEVIVQANTFISTVLPFIELGATPVFVDCLPDSGQIDVPQIEQAITPKTRAIIPVHLYGHPAPVTDISRMLRAENRNDILILEDAAQAHGSSRNGRLCGTFGHMAAFSFYPGKNLGAYGDAGAVVTDREPYAKKLVILRNIGQKKKYDHVILGTNSRLDTIQAAVLSVKLKYLDRWNTQRNAIAQKYLNGLSEIGDIILPNSGFGTRAPAGIFREARRTSPASRNYSRTGYPTARSDERKLEKSGNIPVISDHKNDGEETRKKAGEARAPEGIFREARLNEDKIFNNWHLFVIQTRHRNKLTEYLDTRGIHTGIHYPVPLHLTPALKFLGYKKGDFPVSEHRAATILTLPLYAELENSEVDYIISEIRHFYSGI